MVINIDEKVCKRHKLDVEDVLLMLVIKNADLPKTVDDLERRGMIAKEGGDYYVTQKWNGEVDSILCDSERKKDDGKRLESLSKKLLALFPEGKMEGTSYYYRCGTREMALRLKKFFTLYGEYSDDDVLDATKRFVNSFGDDRRYMPLAKYFIMKNKKVTTEDGGQETMEVSQLAEYLENKGCAEERISGDWMTNVRN